MALQSFKKVSSSAPDLSKVQDNVEAVMGPILAAPILDGLLLKSVALASGANTVDHGLNRAPLGYIVCGNSANSSIWDSQSTNNLPSRNLILNASAATTVCLWVF